MKYYPIHLNVNGQKVIVVGGGSVAHQKITGLLEAGAHLQVIAPSIHPEVQKLADNQLIQIIFRSYQKGDLKGAFLVFGATNDLQVNQQIHAEARAKNIYFNAVDQPSECDFIIPSRVTRGDLVITVSTGGKAPFLAKALRQKLEAIFGPEYAQFTDFMGEVREHFTGLQKKNELVPFLEKNWDEILKAIRQGDDLKNKFL